MDLKSVRMARNLTSQRKRRFLFIYIVLMKSSFVVMKGEHRGRGMPRRDCQMPLSDGLRYIKDIKQLSRDIPKRV